MCVCHYFKKNYFTFKLIIVDPLISFLYILYRQSTFTQQCNSPSTENIPKRVLCCLRSDSSPSIMFQVYPSGEQTQNTALKISLAAPPSRWLLHEQLHAPVAPLERECGTCTDSIPVHLAWWPPTHLRIHLTVGDILVNNVQSSDGHFELFSSPLRIVDRQSQYCSFPWHLAESPRYW